MYDIIELCKGESYQIINIIKPEEQTFEEILFDSLIHSIEHAFLDSLKILPFLFLTYLLMEYLEKKTGENANKWLKKAGKTG